MLKKIAAAVLLVLALGAVAAPAVATADPGMTYDAPAMTYN